jgi:predicted RNA-binding protein with PIN domain
VNPRWVLVDGYSVLHFWPRWRQRAGRRLQQQRDALIALLRQYGDATGQRITVVFDGYAARHRPHPPEPTAGIEVLYSEAGKTADDVIERLVGQAESPQNILVVSSDHLERHTVETLGAQSLSCESFQKEVEAALGELAQRIRHHSRRQRLSGS